MGRDTVQEAAAIDPGYYSAVNVRETHSMQSVDMQPVQVPTSKQVLSKNVTKLLKIMFAHGPWAIAPPC